MTALTDPAPVADRPPPLALEPAEVRRQIRLVSTVVRWERVSFARSTPVIAAAVQVRLAADPCVSVVQALAHNESLLRRTQLKLADHPNRYVRLKLTTNPSLHPEAARTLEYDPHDHVLALLARTQQDPEVLRHLATGSNVTVLSLVAANEATPADVLGELSLRSDHTIHSGLSRNRALPTGAARWLPVKILPEAILSRLLADEASSEMARVLATDWDMTFDDLVEAVRHLEVPSASSQVLPR